MSGSYEFLMISAMYENGGNTTQRLFDGHPELFSYPFESQPGTKYVADYLTSLYPVKYRWPVFPLHGTPEGDYATIIDEECKVRIKTPASSKFRDWPIQLDDAERAAAFVRFMEGRPRTRGNLMEAFFRSTAEVWRDSKRSGDEHVYVGYSPIIAVDAEKIIADYAAAHVLQVVRNPWSAYADTKRRAVPLSIEHYMAGWCQNQLHALAAQREHPDRVHILRFEDIIADPLRALGGLLEQMGVAGSEALAAPSWNGVLLEEVYPWGTIRVPTPEANQRTALELSAEETDHIRSRTAPLLDALGYA